MVHTPVNYKIALVGENEKPEDPKFSAKYMDMSVNPFDDFYSFCNGTWAREHPIPEDKAFWSGSAELFERNRYILVKILEKCATMPHENQDPVQKMLGDFYYSGINEENIESLKFKPIDEYMKKVDSANNREDLLKVAMDLHSIGIPCLFSWDSSTDAKNSEVYAMYLKQGGISLPNRDYYFDDSFDKLRKDYVKHIANMFTLYGFSHDAATKAADAVFKLETRMAGVSRRPEELRDPEKNYNRISMNEIGKRFPTIDFRSYFQQISLPKVDYVVVSQPEFMDGLGKLLHESGVDEWKTYMKWKILHFAAPYLHTAAQDEDFDFFARKLFGRKQKEKRWKRMVSITDSHLGEALGKLYVEQEFGEEAKRRMSDMIEDLREVFTERLKGLDWLSPATKEKALEKFSRFRAKIGYPSKFIDYSSIRITRENFFENITATNNFDFRRYIKRVNSPVDRELWEMTPPTVNAYFSPTENEIVFPAGILQPPFFDPMLDDAVNYGATGGTIAHEITHGFDDEGRKFDADGNIRDWWTQEDEKAFLERAREVSKLYGSLEALPGLKVNGDLTLGENIADIGGVSIAFEALERRLKRNPEMRKEIDGFTPEQRFFIGWGQSWRMNVRDEALRWQVSNDPHSPDNFRAEVPAWVHEKFDSTFARMKGNHLKPVQTIKIW
ncbi:MAG: M13 family metallopeptidase [Candidatus Thermoplasmatota archaeon]|nr:M13 family metallopeptidase [Candidatus Thermoplasmatota archaeon]